MLGRGNAGIFWGFEAWKFLVDEKDFGWEGKISMEDQGPSLLVSEPRAGFLGTQL